MSIFRTHILLPVDDGTVQAGVFQVKRQLEKELNEKNLTNEVKVLETGTVGLLGKGAIVVIYPENIHYYNVREEDVKEIVAQHIIKGRVVETLEHSETGVKAGLKSNHTMGLTREQKRIVLDKGWKIQPDNIEDVLASGGYQAIEKILTEEIKPEEVIDRIRRSDLRGRGGAGFPTGMKWEFTRHAKGDQKYVICNADEGEPGTFKDRLILEGDPHKLVEAMMIAGYAIGATKGYVYIRGEYKLSIQRTQEAIDQAMKYNLLGDNILDTGFKFHLEIKLGAGAYVCGEETALIESIEGKRGQPRSKPPYPVTNGLFGKPTCVNNVETLANIPAIILNGYQWFKAHGTDQSAGTKVFTILGHVEQSGLIEVEMGTPLSEIIFSYGGGIKDGKKFKAALVGGAAGVFLSERLIDVHMDFESLKENKAALGSGAILVMNEDTCVVDMLFSVLKFFAHESCGQCAPCRIGTQQLLSMVYKIREGKATQKDVDQLVKTAETMHNTSLCPLGQSVIMPVKSAVKNFKADFQKKVQTEAQTQEVGPARA